MAEKYFCDDVEDAEGDPPEKAVVKGSDLHRCPEKEARELGLVLVDSEDERLRPHLQIDLDTEEAQAAFLAAWDRWVACKGDGHEIDGAPQTPLVTTSKSGEGQHVYILLPKALPVMTRCAIQASLGSDPAREMFCVLRVMGNKREKRIVLFETHEEAERVWAFLAKAPKRLSFDTRGM